MTRTTRRFSSAAMAWLMAMAAFATQYAAPTANAAVTQQADVPDRSIRLVREFELDQLLLEHPAGLAFTDDRGAFFVLPAPPRTGTSPAETDLAVVTPFEERTGTVEVATRIDDPVNVAFDARRRRLIAYSSQTERLVTVRQDRRGNLDGRNPTVTDARQLSLRDPQGMTVDPDTGDLYVLDSAEPGILRVEPAPNGSFADASVATVDLSQVSDPVGIALDPATGHLHVVSRSEQKLYELRKTGEVVATRDLSGLELTAPTSMTFAPSGDTTDDPGQTSLYLADSGLDSGAVKGATTSDGAAALGQPGDAGGTTQDAGQLLELSFTETPTLAAAAAATFTSDHVQTIDAFNWSPPSPDSSGVIHLPTSDRLLVSDGEVNEMPIFAGANIFESTLQGTLTDTGNTLPFGNNEPTGLGLNPDNQHLFVSKDTPTKSVFEHDKGPDEQYFTSDDIVTTLVTEAFSATDPEGVTFAQGLDVVFIADGLNNEVYQVSPGSNGVLDGVPPAGDDVVVDQFDTFGLGLEDPEGIAYNPDNGNLYLAGKTRNIGSRNFDTLLEVTTSGALVTTIDVSALNPGNSIPKQKLSGLAYGPSSVDPDARVIYIADRGEDNNNDPNENDGRVYEMTLPPNPAAPPTAVDDVAVTSQDTAVTIDVAGNDSDPNGNLDPASANDTCANGSTGCAGASNGTLVGNGDGTITYTPDTGFVGSDSFVYEICDTGVLCSTATVDVTVTVPNDPPVAVDDTATTDEDTAVTIDVAGNDSDPDGNLDAASANSLCANGSTGCVGASNGGLVDNGDGTITYTPAAEFSGADSFVYEICDALGLCSTATVDVTVNAVADPPVAADDTAATSEDTAVTIDVAGNDSDPDGDLDAASANSTCANGSTGCVGASNGTLVGNGDGTITYTPDTGFSGSDSFVYEICDGTSPTPLCDTATVNISVTGGQILYVTSNSGGNVGGVGFKDEDVLTFDTESGTWSMYLDGSDVGLGASGQEIDAFHRNADGSVLLSLGVDDTIPDVGAVGDEDIVRFTPSSTGETTAGSYELFFDGSSEGLTTSGEDIDAVAFDAAGRIVVSTRGTYSTGGISGGDEDLIAFDETAGTWSVYLDGSAVELTASSEDVNGTWIDAAGNVFLTVRGAFDAGGVVGDAADIFTCEPGTTGPITSCAYSMFWDGSDDGFGGEVLNAFFVVGAGGQAGQAPPTAVDDVAVTSQDTAVTIDVAGNDSDPNGNLDPASANDTCANGSTGCAGASNGTLVGNGDGTITYTPDTGFVGSDSFVYEICDTGVLCSTATVDVTVTVPNDPPVAVDDTATTDEDTAVTIDVAGNDSDPDGNLDAASANSLCANGSTGCVGASNGGLVDNGDGTITYTPAAEFSGADSFVYEICDALGLCSTATVDVTVNAVADPPVAADDTAATSEDTAVTIDVAGNDSDPDGDLDAASANDTCANGSTGCVGASNGTLVGNGDGTITYTPDTGFSGSDSFVYEICDGTSPTPLCDTATVNITVSSGLLYFLSFDVNTTVPGLAAEVRDEDIVTYDPATGTWAVYVDASDVGITSEVNAMHVRADGSVLMSFPSTISVPGLTGGPAGEAVEDRDVVVFTPTATGETTAGNFSFHFDGSDVGLDASSEDITGLHEFADGSLGITTRGNVSVPNLAQARDEDVLRFTGTFGSATTGTWSLYFNGLDAGFSASDDLNAVSFDQDNDMLFSTRAAYAAAGGAGDDEDVSRFVGTFPVPTSGTASLELDLSAVGIDSAVDLDGLHARR